jgi:hypothetical protein
LNLPDTIKRLGEASNALKISVDERKKLTEMEQLTKDLESAKEKAEEQASQLKEENSKLDKSIKSLETALLTPKTIEISNGNSIPLIENSYYLGVTGVHPSFVSTTLNNDSKNMDVGNKMTFMAGQQSCTVTLKQINPSEEKATFLFNCNP